MFITDKLVYIELQKTGGTHICRLLARYTDGHAQGKHNRIPDAYRDRFILGSIRNPWDWYVSLWAYGVGGKGSVRRRVTRGLDPGFYHCELPKQMGKNWLMPLELVRSVYHDALKPVASWSACYCDHEDPEQFRIWLKLLLDNRRRFDIGEGYGFSPLSRSAGLLTFRYLRLFTPGDLVYKKKMLSSRDGIRDFDARFNFTNDVIRTETLETDFARVMEALGYDMDAHGNDAASGRTNKSKRLGVEHYYDAETLEIVAQREQFIIDKYDYAMPGTDVW